MSLSHLRWNQDKEPNGILCTTYDKLFLLILVFILVSRDVATEAAAAVAVISVFSFYVIWIVFQFQYFLKFCDFHKFPLVFLYFSAAAGRSIANHIILTQIVDSDGAHTLEKGLTADCHPCYFHAPTCSLNSKRQSKKTWASLTWGGTKTKNQMGSCALHTTSYFY